MTSSQPSYRKFPGVFSLKGQEQNEKIDAFFDFNRQLVATNAIDDLLDIVVRYAAHILNLSFCQVIVLGNDGSFVFRSQYPNTTQLDLPWEKSDGRLKVIKVFQRAAMCEEPTHIIQDHKRLTQGERLVLDWVGTQALVIIPMRVNNKPIGLFILGDEEGKLSEAFVHGGNHLPLIIADQAAGAVYRAMITSENTTSQFETVLALSKTIETRDWYTGGHSKKMANLAEKLAIEMHCNLDDIQTIRWAALLHDIGKIGIPDDILLKPGPLTLEEWKIMQRHPEIGSEIVLKVSNLTAVADLILAHHEKYDGTGYPYRLKGEEIPLGARILAVVDAYCAITDGRVYRKARSHKKAINELELCSGTCFDPAVVRVFTRCFPTE
ncbi:MAG TPA: HD domain-containing phosphohydrolase [Longilinea sp.]|nr:HD domain-containing phosphohydrolase [Longilinea sp.]